MSSPKTTILTEMLAKDFDQIVINGQTFSTGASSIEVPKGHVRVTLLSNIYQPVTLDTEAERIGTSSPAKKPWISGTCFKADLHWSETSTPAKPFFNQSCVQPVATQSHHAPSPENFSLGTSTTQKPPFYQRTWFWVGVGAITTAVVIAQINSQKSSTRPSSKDGF
jgi:hypothetical protein